MSHGLNLQYVSSRVIQSYYRFIDVKAQVQTTFVGFSSFRRLLLFSGTSVGTLPTLESLQMLDRLCHLRCAQNISALLTVLIKLHAN